MQNNETKQTILIKSAHLFSKKGYFGVSMEEIAEEVGIKKSAIYYHFSSKEGLLKELLDNCLRGLRDIVYKTVENSKTPFDLWYNLVYELLTYRSKHPEIMLLASFGFLPESDIPALQYMINIRHQLFDFIRDFLENAKVIGSQNSKRVSYLTLQLFSLILSPFMTENPDYKNLAEEYSKIFTKNK